MEKKSNHLTCVKSVNVVNYVQHLPYSQTFEAHFYYSYLREYCIYILPLSLSDDEYYTNHEALVKMVFHLETSENVIYSDNSPF